MERCKKFILGTSITITSRINAATATTAAITIQNPANTKVVNAAAMTKAADNTYTYDHQTVGTDIPGEYVITIDITISGKTTRKQKTVELFDDGL